jgi:hypothetical protein
MLSIVESHDIHYIYYTEARRAEVSLEKDKVYTTQKLIIAKLYFSLALSSSCDKYTSYIAIPSLVNNQWMGMC